MEHPAFRFGRYIHRMHRLKGGLDLMDLCTTEPAKLFDQTLPSCHVRQPTGRQPGGELAPGGQSFPQPVRILSPVFQIAIALHSPKRRLPPGVGVCRTATPRALARTAVTELVDRMVGPNARLRNRF